MSEAQKGALVVLDRGGKIVKITSSLHPWYPGRVFYEHSRPLFKIAESTYGVLLRNGWIDEAEGDFQGTEAVISPKGREVIARYL